jgi:hypothetical protein
MAQASGGRSASEQPRPRGLATRDANVRIDTETVRRRVRDAQSDTHTQRSTDNKPAKANGLAPGAAEVQFVKRHVAHSPAPPNALVTTRPRGLTRMHARGRISAHASRTRARPRSRKAVGLCSPLSHTQRYFMKPMSDAYSRKQRRQMSRPYLRIRPRRVLQTRLRKARAGASHMSGGAAAKGHDVSGARACAFGREGGGHIPTLQRWGLRVRPWQVSGGFSLRAGAYQRRAPAE